MPESDAGATTEFSIQIANDVIGTIAAMAASDVPGIAGPSGGLVSGLTELLGKRSWNRGVRVEVDDRRVSLDLHLVVLYGSCIPDVASRVQDRVKTQVEWMTGLQVKDVNVHIQGVSFELDAKPEEPS